MQTLGYAVADRDLHGTAARPPRARRHLVTLRRRIGPRQLGAFQHPNRNVLAFHLLHLLAIDRNKPPLHHRHQVELLGHPLLMREECFHACDLFASHVNQKDIG